MSVGLVGVSLLLSSCEREKGSLSELEARLDELETSFAGVKKTAAQLRRDLSLLNDTRTRVEEDTDTAREAVMALLTERESLVKRFETYRSDYHDAIIKRATGLELGDVMVGGVTYRAARVKMLDAWEVSLNHNAGVTRVELVNLPDNLKTLLGYDPSVGPKPEPVVAGGSLAVPAEVESSGVAAAPASGGGSAAAPVPAARPRFAPVAPACSVEAESSRSKKVHSERSGHGSEVIARFSGVGMGGYSSGGGGGNSIKGGKSEVPEGYKPIGSSYSGTAMDRKYKKTDR